MNTIRARLKGGDLRSLGDSHRVVKRVSEHPDLFAELFANLFDNDRVVRMRAADSVEKVTREHSELMQAWKRPLLESICNLKDKEVRWHVAQMLPRLRLTPAEQETVVQILITYLSDESSIVKTHSMQALADLAMKGAFVGTNPADHRPPDPNGHPCHASPRPEVAKATREIAPVPLTRLP